MKHQDSSSVKGLQDNMPFFHISKLDHCVSTSIIPTDNMAVSNTRAQAENDGLVQDCSNSSALAMELLQFCTNASKW